jgi:predicted RNase H-like HicB family nuclease
MSSVIWTNQADTIKPDDEWKSATRCWYRFHVLVTRDENGTYSAVALNLPGVGSCGDTEAEAIENFKEAAIGAVESYKDDREEIPWKDTSSESVPFGARWIVVHA